jgi:tetratricopeptide (TPR) repeat protein
VIFSPGDGPPAELPITVSSMEQFNRAETGGAVYAVQNGDQYVYLYRNAPPYWLEPFADPPPVPAQLVQRTPSWLLSARHQVVPFYGRDEDLAWLRNWRDSTTLNTSVRLVHGPGGQGKTRLAAEFAAFSGHEGWTVIVARHHSDATAHGGGDQQFTVYKPGMLVIVDYAERWPLADLVALLRQHHEVAVTPVKILLLARPGGSWWQSLVYQLSKINIADAQQRELPPLADQTQDRQALYAAAHQRFAAALGIAARGNSAMPYLGDPHFGLVLSIHMKALADATAAGRGETPPSGRDQAALSAYLLDREYDYWQTAYHNGKGPIRTSELAMSRAVYTATLTRPLSHSAGVAALTRARISEATVEPVSQVLADHANLYPPADPETVLEPLYPDRLGEDFIALTTPGHTGTLYNRIGMWAAGLPGSLLIADDDASHVKPVITVLIEVAARWPHVAEGELFSLLRQRPELALIAGGAALARLAELQAPGIINVLELVEKKLDLGSNVTLDIGIAALSTRLIPHRLNRTKNQSGQAYLHHEHAQRLSHAGLDDQAIVASEEAVRIMREWAPTSGDPEESLRLAMALRTLSGICLSLSRYEAALAAAEEAVQILRELPSDTENKFKTQLAHAIEKLGACLMELSRPEEALAANQEAEEIYLQLIADNHDDLESQLAFTVVNRGSILARMGRHEQAVSASTRAVIVFRRLAHDSPSSFMPLHAHALDNLAAQLTDIGQLEQALAVGEEALRLEKQLAAANPRAFEPRLLIMLDNLAVRLWRLGRREESIATVEEALEILRRRFDNGQADIGLQLAKRTEDLGSRLWETERREEAVAAVGEALQILRPLANAQPTTFAADLTSTAKDLGARLWLLDRREEAIATVGEAIQILQPLANAQPSTFAADLESLLDLRSSMLSLAKKPEKGLITKLRRLGRHANALAADHRIDQIDKNGPDPRDARDHHV